LIWFVASLTEEVEYYKKQHELHPDMLADSAHCNRNCQDVCFKEGSFPFCTNCAFTTNRPVLINDMLYYTNAGFPGFPPASSDWLFGAKGFLPMGTLQTHRQSQQEKQGR
jgi:hypothetical protein